jgi:flagellar capping protein FliD
MHLADDYDASKDMIRISCTSETLENSVESLTYTVEKVASQTTEIGIAWDKTKIKFVLKSS